MDTLRTAIVFTRQACTAILAAVLPLLTKYKTYAYFDGTARQNAYKKISY